MPIPRPSNEESKNEFIERCMSDNVMQNEFSDNDQRLAVCFQKWEEKKKKALASININGDEIIFL